MMLNLIRNEINKIITKKSLIALGFIILLFCSITLVSSFKKYGIYDSHGSYETGYRAVKANRVFKEKLNGVLTKEDIVNCITIYKHILGDTKNYDSSGNLRINNPKSMKQMATYSDLADLLTRVYSPLNTFNPKALTEKNLNEINASDIITNRHKNLEVVLQNDYSNDFLSQKNSIEFGYSQGWQSLFSDLQQISVLLIIMVAILISPVFSREYRDKTAPVIYTSKYGKSKVVTSKIIASISISTSLYFLTVGLYSFIKLIIFGFDGYDLYIQSSSAYWLSLMPLTFLQAFTLIVGVGFISIIVTTIICLLISMLVKRDYISIISTLLMILIPIIMADNTFFQQILSFMPSNMVNYSIFLLSFQQISAFNIEFNISFFRLIVMSVYSVFIVLIVKHFIKVKQL